MTDHLAHNDPIHEKKLASIQQQCLTSAEILSEKAHFSNQKLNRSENYIFVRISLISITPLVWLILQELKQPVSH